MSDERDDAAVETAGTSAHADPGIPAPPVRTLWPQSRRGRSLVGSIAAIVAAGVIAWVWLADTPPDDVPAPGATLTFTATAYCKGTTTASGSAVRRGVAAADRDVLPPGSIVSLSTGDREFDGVYAVLDTGPLVRGRILDLYVWSCNEALAFGRRKVGATILRLGWDPRASAPSLADRLFRRRAAGGPATNGGDAADDADPRPAPKRRPSSRPVSPSVPAGEAPGPGLDDPAPPEDAATDAPPPDPAAVPHQGP